MSVGSLVPLPDPLGRPEYPGIPQYTATTLVPLCSTGPPWYFTFVAVASEKADLLARSVPLNSRRAKTRRNSGPAASLSEGASTRASLARAGESVGRGAVG